MSEKKENIKAKDEGIATILLKLDLHCEGCAKKVKRSVRRFEGVEEVKADYSTGKLMVKGNVDPLWLRERVEIKTKKEVQLLSDQPKKASGGGGGDSSGGGDIKSDEKVEKKAEEKKSEDEKPKKAQFNTEVMNVRLHCDSGSALKVKRFIKELTPYLKDKLNRTVDVVPPKKDGGSGGGYNKKEKELASGSKKKDGGGDNRKKEKEASVGGGGSKKKDGESPVAPSKSTEPKERKAEAMNKMEYYGYNNPNTYYGMPPRYNQNYYNQDYGVGNQDYGVAMHNHGIGHPGYVPPQHDHGYGHTGYVPPPHDHGYSHRGYVPPPHDHGYGHTGYVPPPYSAPQFFSDENPDACSVM